MGIKKFIIVFIAINILYILLWIYKTQQHPNKCKNYIAVENMVKNGDLIFIYSKKHQEISSISNYNYNHVGVLYRLSNVTFVYHVDKFVTETPLVIFLKDVKNFEIKRLKNANVIITASNYNKMVEVGKTFFKLPLDKKLKWSDTKMYSSELIWKIYKKAINIELAKPKNSNGKLIITPKQIHKSKKLITISN